MKKEYLWRKIGQDWYKKHTEKKTKMKYKYSKKDGERERVSKKEIDEYPNYSIGPILPNFVIDHIINQKYQRFRGGKSYF